MDVRKEARVLCQEVDRILEEKTAVQLSQLDAERARVAAILEIVRKDNDDLASLRSQKKQRPPGSEVDTASLNANAPGPWASGQLEDAIKWTHSHKARKGKPRNKTTSSDVWQNIYPFSVVARAGSLEHKHLTIESLQRELRQDSRNPIIQCELGLRYLELLRFEDAATWFSRATKNLLKPKSKHAVVNDADEDDHWPEETISVGLHLEFETYLRLGVEEKASLVRSQRFASAASALRFWLDHHHWHSLNLAEADESMHIVEDVLRPMLYEDQDYILQNHSLGPLGDLHIQVLKHQVQCGETHRRCESLKRLGHLLSERRDFAEACDALQESSCASVVLHPQLPSKSLQPYVPWKDHSHAYDQFDAIVAHRARKKRNEKHMHRKLMCAKAEDSQRLEQNFVSSERHRIFATGVRTHHQLTTSEADIRVPPVVQAERNLNFVEGLKASHRPGSAHKLLMARERYETEGLLQEEIATHELGLVSAQQRESPKLQLVSYP